MTDYSKIVTTYLKKNKDFQEAIKIVNMNSLDGNIWLIGGQVFRPILKELYNLQFNNEYDFDFIVEKPVLFNEIIIPKGWSLTKTGLGEPRFTNGEKQIDLISLDNSINHYLPNDITKLTSQQKIESYFSKVPLNIQAIAYNLNKKKILGKDGIDAIDKKIIEVNCIKECLTFCKRRKISVYSFINNKIKGDLFKRVYPKFNSTNKELTIKYYNNNALDYTARNNFKNFIVKYLPKELNLFLEGLPGKKILDVGAGNGRDSIIFKKKNYQPIAIDISRTMIELSKKNGIEAYVKDIEDCDLGENTFDGVFAYCSLLHIPKERINNSLARISELLKPNGKFFIGMIKGDKEIIFDNRFFSLYSEEELATYLKEYFEILAQRSFKVGSQIYINFVCSKKI